MKLFSDPAFTMYAMECEGDLPTHLGDLNRAVEEHRRRGLKGIDYSLLVTLGISTSITDEQYILSRL